MTGAMLAACTSAQLDARSAECPVDVDLAALVAASDHILIARMDFSPTLLVEEASSASPQYVELPLLVESWIKGGNNDHVSLRHFPSDAPYKPSMELMADLAGKPAILFLTQVDEGPIGLYFAGYSADALRYSDEGAIDAIRYEVARQSNIASGWQTDSSLPHFDEVSDLVSQLGVVSGVQQQRVFDSLINLGADAVPAMVSQMDDHRPLLTRSISLENRSPDAFEATRHYGPNLVVDGLDAVLNHITGFGGSIVNGGSERAREAAVAGWKVYASDMGCRAPKSQEK
ncbi:hypothetical protein [Qipengyuania gelatinilytica]|uniref:Uncharacterized protein n=1 Tax=Qipengyuania gelatinilytica TaxID=2867231 RepID=A0ABX9A401_9SPHN|nr:hypothetical protein [Qipengyuania gelatinilytica]QZD95844.1 hypothetical protein K3136_03775 [Qipengyuania gelatinilytica]